MVDICMGSEQREPASIGKRLVVALLYLKLHPVDASEKPGSRFVILTIPSNFN
jgi:hypothetical protein